ncbi:MAG: DNA-3-methyladenine glycosylase 2 family protein [Clostridia bacterium]|nr:DNA-3-methyladenine glycosylase 2 family protein [Clostridia bacterium]
MRTELKDNTLYIRELNGFDLKKSAECGQAFRWKACDFNYAAGETAAYTCVLSGRPIRAAQLGDGLSVHPCKEGEERFFINYFDLERDYEGIEKLIADDRRLSVCLPGASGIRVFNQDPFEALISFIISANNNIKRISGIIDRLCMLAGQEIEFCGTRMYAFPEPSAIAALSVKQLQDIGAGYRAPYIIDSAKRIADGYELEKLRGLSLEEARKELLAFKGVGPKVCDCILLFSLGHTDAFPIDVWIDRAMKELFFDSIPPKRSEMQEAVLSIGRYSGIIQQYIFYYARSIQLGKNN